jgi:hypothetical protein
VRPSPVATLVLLGAIAVVACSPVSGNVPPSNPLATDIAMAPTTRPETAFACPLTRPNPPFLPPDPFMSKPPASYGSAWFGRADLWTMLSFGGEDWHDLPHNPGGLTQKTFWWSANWPFRKELEPAITVVGRRLDGAGQFSAGDPGTNATADFGTAMLVGVDVPSAGCWQITATYRGAELSYVVRVKD